MIRVQREDFDVGAELERLAAGNPRIGGVASFIGLVRDMGGDDRVSALTLEHYPGMTEKKLGEIETEAHRRWPLDAVVIIHRYGRLAARRPHRARRHRLAAPRSRARRLPVPDRLAKDRRALLEERRNPGRRALGRLPHRGRSRQAALDAASEIAALVGPTTTEGYAYSTRRRNVDEL